MIIKKEKLISLILATLFVACINYGIAREFDSKAAWQELESVLQQQYAYLDRPDFDVKEHFKEFELRVVDTETEQDFIDISQLFIRHFLDPHLNMGPYDENDVSVFPTGSDIRASYQKSKFIIEDVKAGGAADSAHIRPGDEVVSIDGVPAEESVEKLFGKGFHQLSLKQINYGVNISLGGYRNKARVIGLKKDGGLKPYTLAASYESINTMANGPTLSYEKRDDVGYIRFNNSLGNNKTVEEFANAIDYLLDTQALIIDLRNTPSGGNTGVAEPILGHFVDKRTAYQRYQKQQNGILYNNASMQTAHVTPTAPHYTKPFIVLAGRWTGSMGEGMTIGLDALGALNIVGAPMADLLGGIKTVTLAESNAWIELGFERLYHVDNTFREDFEPDILIVPADRDIHGNDPALTVAREILSKLLRGAI